MYTQLNGGVKGGALKRRHGTASSCRSGRAPVSEPFHFGALAPGAGTRTRSPTSDGLNRPRDGPTLSADFGSADAGQVSSTVSKIWQWDCRSEGLSLRCTPLRFEGFGHTSVHWEAKMTMRICVLSQMTPDQIRGKLGNFTASYVLDWEEWLRVADSDRVAKFASILRRWQGTRPSPMRRPKEEAKHDPPYIVDLLKEATPAADPLLILVCA
jgi:hypothetical protein